MSLINRIFRKPELIGYSVIETDIHSHYLPGVDDGCKETEESLLLLKRMYECGFRKIFCTPHIQSEYYRNSRENILPVFDKLRDAVSDAIPGLELDVAAEYLIDDGFERKVKEGLIFLGNNKHVLVELSYFNPFPKFRNVLQDILMKGYTPVLAHPERYLYWPVEESVFEDLHAAGVLFQVNLPSICGYYGPEVRKRAFDMIEKGFVSLAGSDIHNVHYADAVCDGLNNKKVQSILKSGVFKNSEIFGSKSAV
ncbi:MAG: tyrosine-protein phosphatase [Bacteroidales bacterium]